MTTDRRLPPGSPRIGWNLWRYAALCAVTLAIGAGVGLALWQAGIHSSVPKSAVVVQQSHSSSSQPSAAAQPSRAPAPDARTGQATRFVASIADALAEPDRAVQAMNTFLAPNGFGPIQTIAPPLGAAAMSGALQSMNAFLAPNGVPPLRLSANASVVVSGLQNPRGLKFGPDGLLYVAEGGAGGSSSTAGQCQQVPPPVGPYSGSALGGRVSLIRPDGTRTTVVDGLPSSSTAAAAGSFVSGIADIAFIGDTIYGLEGGAGCSHGVAGVPNQLFRVYGDGSWSTIANLSQFQQTHPTAVIEPDDFEPDGTWYSLLAKDGVLYAVEPNHGELDAITLDGTVSRVADISASQGHLVPTAMAVGPDGSFYIGNLWHFPVEAGSAKVIRVTPDGQVSVAVTGLTVVTGVAFDAQGRLYVLENGRGGTDPMGPPVLPGTGRVLRVGPAGELAEVATGLTFPTAMTFGPDGALYVSDVGYGPPSNAGGGQIVRIDVCGGPC